MTEEEKEELKELIALLYNDNLSQYGKRKLETYISKLQKENELLKAPLKYANGNTLDKRYVELNFISKDKIRELREIDNIDYLQFKLKELLGE